MHATTNKFSPAQSRILNALPQDGTWVKENWLNDQGIFFMYRSLVVLAKAGEVELKNENYYGWVRRLHVAGDTPIGEATCIIEDSTIIVPPIVVKCPTCLKEHTYCTMQDRFFEAKEVVAVAVCVTPGSTEVSFTRHVCRCGGTVAITMDNGDGSTLYNACTQDI